MIAGELTPADAARSILSAVTGIATAHGTATAHAAILARALGLPAVVGLGDAVLAIPEGTTAADRRRGRHAPGRPPSDDRAADATERRERADRRRGAARELAPTSSAPPATGRGSRCSRTWAPPARRPGPSSSAPRESACSVPSSCSSTAPSCPMRRSRPRPCGDRGRARRAPAGRAHARRRRRQAAAGAADAA